MRSRVVILGRPPEGCTTARQATIQRSLEGLSRSLAKELKKAIAVQLVYVAAGGEAQIESTLRFLLSPRSAYVSGQVIHIGAPVGHSATPADWRLPLHGKKVLVTGASRGIGASIAEVMARKGAAVICLDAPQAQAGLDEIATHLGATVLALDIGATDAPQKLVDVAEAICWFASPASSVLTGNVVRVCGQSLIGAYYLTRPAHPLQVALGALRSNRQRPSGVKTLSKLCYTLPRAVLGTVHLANHIHQHQQLQVGDDLRVEMRIGTLIAHEKGQVFTLEFAVLRDNTLVWEAIQTLLRIGVAAPSGKPYASHFAASFASDTPLSHQADFAAPADIGRRYARVSGDFNPIHLPGLPRPCCPRTH